MRLIAKHTIFRMFSKFNLREQYSWPKIKIEEVKPRPPFKGFDKTLTLTVRKRCKTAKGASKTFLTQLK